MQQVFYSHKKKEKKNFTAQRTKMLQDAAMANVVKEGKKIGRNVQNNKSRSKRAGLIFPVGRCSRLLRKGKYASRIGGGAAIYLTAVLEYLSAEVLDMSGIATRDNHCKRITPRHLQLAARSDTALDELFKDVDWMQGGVIPHIEKALLPLKVTRAVTK